MLKLYTDSSFLNDTYRSQLFPLLFDLCITKNEQITNIYEIVEKVQEADVIVFPIHLNGFSKHKKALSYFDKIIKMYNKPIWIYTSGDYGYTLNNKYYTFRFGGFSSKLNEKSVVLPAFINDPYLNLKSEFYVLDKTELPEIGFVGHAKSGIFKYLKELNNHLNTRIKHYLKKEKHDKQPFYPSGYKRAKYLKRLSKSLKIKCHFIYRNKYRAGIHTEKEKIKTTNEFYQNMSNSPYTFCIRGVGNFSVRFYETLAMGRIPVLIDTDCKLPFDDIINWSNHAVIINEKEIDVIQDKLVSFHDKFTPEAFKKLQISNRKLWLDYLERISYFTILHKQFKS